MELVHKAFFFMILWNGGLEQIMKVSKRDYKELVFDDLLRKYEQYLNGEMDKEKFLYWVSLDFKTYERWLKEHEG